MAESDKDTIEVVDTKPKAGGDEPGWLRPLVDYGPLAAFLAGYLLADLLVATAALMAATALALILSLAIARRVPKMALVTAGVVGVFGALTLIFDDPVFIKMKPTIVQAIFALVLLGGLAFGRSLLKPVMGMALPWGLSDRGWYLLTLRWGVFFAVMAVVNEAVWRTQSTDFWVTFKVFGILAATMIFAVAQVPLLTRYKLEEAES